MSATASFEALTPTSFLLRSGRIYADRAAVIDGDRRFTYAEHLERCLRLAGALRNMGVAEGGRVAVLAPNTHVLLEAHCGVPFAGAVLVALNTRLTPADLSFIVAHSGAQVLIYDHESMAMETRLDCDSTFLWTLPMFHCNGWCFPWGVTAAGAVHLCLRRFDPDTVWKHLQESNVTHLNGAPTVLVMLAWHPAAGRLARSIRVATGGAPPTPAILQRMAELGMDVTHLYGLTETFGPAAICEWRGEWSRLGIEEQARIKARQGVGNVISQLLRVVDAHGKDVPADGRTLGEIALRGNNVMLGHYLDEIATRKAIPDGWFGDGGRGGRGPGSRVGRSAHCVRHAQGRCGCDRAGAHRLGAPAHRALQGAEARRVRRAAEERNGQNPEIRAARACTGIAQRRDHPVVTADDRR
jgi:acyl-CoA synthetase (AMP-forming)/AMP-acid ligase II